MRALPRAAWYALPEPVPTKDALKELCAGDAGVESGEGDDLGDVKEMDRRPELRVWYIPSEKDLTGTTGEKSLRLVGANSIDLAHSISSKPSPTPILTCSGSRGFTGSDFLD
jgi:hypothetical protein